MNIYKLFRLILAFFVVLSVQGTCLDSLEALFHSNDKQLLRVEFDQDSAFKILELMETRLTIFNSKVSLLDQSEQRELIAKITELEREISRYAARELVDNRIEDAKYYSLISSFYRLDIELDQKLAKFGVPSLNNDPHTPQILSFDVNSWREFTSDLNNLQPEVVYEVSLLDGAKIEVLFDENLYNDLVSSLKPAQQDRIVRLLGKIPNGVYGSSNASINGIKKLRREEGTFELSIHGRSIGANRLYGYFIGNKFIFVSYTLRSNHGSSNMLKGITDNIQRIRALRGE